MTYVKSKSLSPLLALAMACLTAAPAIAIAGPAKKKATATVLWEGWYTVTGEKGAKIYYYHDTVEKIGDKVSFQNNLWMSDEGFVNQESVKSFSMDNEDLTPLAFNVVSQNRNTETLLNGTILDGKTLQVAIKDQGKDTAPVKRTLTGKPILSNFFQLWLARRLSKMREGSPVPFTSIMETNLQDGFKPDAGMAYLEKPDEKVKKLGGKVAKIRVRIKDLDSFWYIEANGNVVHIENPALKRTVQRVTREIAEKFLEP